LKYVRLCNSVRDTGRLVLPEQVADLVTSDKDWYTSCFYYDDKQFEQFKQTGTIKGIKEVTTNKLWFDFDNKDNPEKAREAALTLVNRLQEQIPVKDIELYFSGNKGYNVNLTLTKWYSPKQVAEVARYFAKDLPLDWSMYDHSQLLRVPGTKHNVSGLYKIPLTLQQLTNLNTNSIKEIAQSLENVTSDFHWDKATLNDSLFVSKEVVKDIKEELDPELKRKPYNWKDYKWALAQGNFGDEPGERHHVMMILASTCRAMGYDKTMTYYMCKSALKKQAARTGRDEFPKEELWDNIIEASVFSDSWTGGQYSPKNDPWLKNYCEKNGFIIEDSEGNVTSITQAFDQFKNYAVNIDDLTIKSGIPSLDAKLRMTTGMSIGLVAAPGVGKTSIAIQILNNMSKAGHRSIFFSYDMYSALVYQKLVQKHMNMSSDDIFKSMADPTFQARVQKIIGEEYKNVDFCFKAGQTTGDILETIRESEDKSGQKVKFVVMDYNELVISDHNDPTASSSYVAQKMREYANVHHMCVLSLFQPNKMAGSPSDEITSYRAAKGSSAIEQSVSTMLGMSRPGFNPNKPENDIFTTIKCLKNRMGPIFSLDYYWDGLRGSIEELSDDERKELKRLREEKAGETKKEDWV